MIDRIARSTPIWVHPLVTASVLIPHAIAVVALLQGEWRTALSVLVAVYLSNLGTSMSRKYYDPHRHPA